MPIEYTIEANVQDAVDAVLQNPTFREFDALDGLRVVAVQKSKTNKDGDFVQSQKEPISIKKIPDVFQPLIKEADILMVVDYYCWEHVLEGPKRDAAIHRALMSLDVESVDGALKIGTRKPDIQEFMTTIARFGAYSEPLCIVKQSFKDSGKQFIDRMLAVIDGKNEDTESDDDSDGDEEDPE